MPNVLRAAATLIAAFPPQNRIAKNLQSLYSQSQPPPAGIVHLWRFTTGRMEAKAIAESCRDLITAGISPKQILILLSNRRALGPEIIAHLQGANVPFTVAAAQEFRDADVGRLLLSILRIVCDQNDYVAHRILLGLRAGVGVGTCNAICEAVIGAGGLNYRRIFYDPLPPGVFSARALRSLNAARAICAQIAQWTCDDQIGARRQEIRAIITDVIGPAVVQQFDNFAAALPDEMLLQELRDYLWADTDEQQATILERVYTRLGQQVPRGGCAARASTHYDHARCERIVWNDCVHTGFGGHDSAGDKTSSISRIGLGSSEATLCVDYARKNSVRYEQCLPSIL